MNNFIVVSFYTDHTVYEGVMENYLKPSLEKFQLPHVIYKHESLGSWNKNVTLKPYSIKLAFEQYNCDVVFLDADAVIERRPDLFYDLPQEFDIAAHYLDWNSHYGYSETPPRKELLSGTIYLRNNAKVKALVNDWYYTSQLTTIWEQKVLESCIKKNESEYKIYSLPLEYIWLKSLPDGREPLEKLDGPVVISHAQVSRQLKRFINGV